MTTFPQSTWEIYRNKKCADERGTSINKKSAMVHLKARINVGDAVTEPGSLIALGKIET